MKMHALSSWIFSLWGFLSLLLPGNLLLTSGCGEGGLPPSSDLDNKIVGGRDAKEAEFPWQASLQRLTWLGFYHTCGATLVTQEWLVTAAHCIQLNSVSPYRIMIGNYNLSTVTEDQLHPIKMIVIKQGFDPDTFHNDIALIQLVQPVPDSTISICLTDKPLKANTIGVVAGWGATTDGGKASPWLQVANVDIIVRQECFDYYGEDAITDSMTCAGYDEGGIDACQGDSGGPLLQWQNGKAYLVGIVSWGVGCAEPKQPGVYTDVFQFVSWIKYYILINDKKLTE